MRKGRSPFASRDAEIDRLRAKLADIEEGRAMQPFLDEFTRNVMTLVAYTPVDRWPSIVKTAFRAAEKDIPSGAAIYKKRNSEGAKDA